MEDYSSGSNVLMACSNDNGIRPCFVVKRLMKAWNALGLTGGLKGVQNQWQLYTTNNSLTKTLMLEVIGFDELKYAPSSKKCDMLEEIGLKW